ncbi:sulfotransferase domain-containing protein [Sneathiella glossodoripedis]|uniref:sulfotransferase domain-containing protein n=1 Tax=Sneathiella glossodoripedis TaxID=418853 RepID=UPI000472A942|nr:sulfotransferase domain-containing protein [Sneathiella glossodoripedis]
MAKRNNRLLNIFYISKDATLSPLLGKQKNHLFIACAPKSASTFISHVFAELPGMKRRSLVPGWGEREQELCAIRLSRYNLTHYVAQHHTKYSDTLEKYIKQYNLKPIVLVRNLADTVVSICDHLRTETIKSPMVAMDRKHMELDDSTLQEMIARLSIPWFLSFYGSWRYSGAAPIYHYDDYTTEPLNFIMKVAKDLNIGQNSETIEQAIKKAQSKGSLRFNIGKPGRGAYLSQPAKDSLARLLDFYPEFRDDPLFVSTRNSICQ